MKMMTKITFFIVAGIISVMKGGDKKWTVWKLNY